MTATLTEREHEHFLQTYKRLALEVDHAHGMYVHTLNGDRYLDFLGGIAVNALGHSHPRVIEAIERQLRRYMHLSNYFYQDAQITFVEKLCQLSGYDRAFLSNSGTEAADGAIKFARAWGNPQGKTTVIGFTGGFHGRTYGALSIMDKPRYKDGMGPFLPDCHILPFNDPAALRSAMDGTVCGVVIEHLQGEGGIEWATEEFVRELFALREQHGFLVIADEVQAGAGRTGTFFGFDRFNVRPDVVTVAKGVGGGLPLGAILTTEALATIWGAGQHGTTFGGNAVACAAGLVVLEELENGLMENINATGEYLRQQLEGLKEKFPAIIRDVRGAGAMMGLGLKLPADPFVQALLRRKIIANATSETVIRLLPPYIFQPEHVDALVEKLTEVFQEQVPPNAEFGE
ncbi:MAG: acetylornithine transaminase [Armatimonadetes bacterium]|nr:acetylornithine transaminase [Armatimonadota bacterium]